MQKLFILDLLHTRNTCTMIATDCNISHSEQLQKPIAIINVTGFEKTRLPRTIISN